MRARVVAAGGELNSSRHAVGYPQCFEEPSEMSQMVGPRVHDNVVYVSNGGNPFHATQERVHHSLENSRARSVTEGQSAVLMLAVSGHEAGFGTILFLNFYLVEPMAHIHNREVPFAIEGGQNVVRTRKRLLRYHTVLVNFSVITTQPPGP